MRADVDLGHALFGKSLPCPSCHDYLESSRLNEEERGHELGMIRSVDTDRGIHEVMRYMALSMVADPYGFLSVYGGYGTAKSLMLTATVAEFCRRGKHAVYYRSDEIADRLFKDLKGESDYGRYFRTVPVLAIDELDDLKLIENGGGLSYIGREISAIIDERYRQRNSLVTLLAFQDAPAHWMPGDVVSRVNDGRFYRDWPDALPVPECLDGDRRIPGILEINAPDLRPFLRSGRPLVQVHPESGEVLRDDRTGEVWQM